MNENELMNEAARELNGVTEIKVTEWMGPRNEEANEWVINEWMRDEWRACASHAAIKGNSLNVHSLMNWTELSWINIITVFTVSTETSNKLGEVWGNRENNEGM